MTVSYQQLLLAPASQGEENLVDFPLLSFVTLRLVYLGNERKFCVKDRDGREREKRYPKIEEEGIEVERQKF